MHDMVFILGLWLVLSSRFIRLKQALLPPSIQLVICLPSHTKGFNIRSPAPLSSRKHTYMILSVETC